jgi:hypothetical protein
LLLDHTIKKNRQETIVFNIATLDDAIADNVVIGSKIEI